MSSERRILPRLIMAGSFILPLQSACAKEGQINASTEKPCRVEEVSVQDKQLNVSLKGKCGNMSVVYLWENGFADAITKPDFN